jgi:hypothetical protein
MLTVFRIVLPAVLNPEDNRGLGSPPVGAGEVGGSRLDEGARRPLLGVFGVDLLEGAPKLPVLFLVLGTGRAGSAIVGGALEGRGGLGSAVDISINLLGWYRAPVWHKVERARRC